MYLSIKQHDQFRTLLMGFEIPFRGYIADVLMTHYSSANDLETALLAKNASLTPADPFFLRDVLPNSVKHSKIEKMYNTFSTASLTTEIVAVDQDMCCVVLSAISEMLSTFGRCHGIGDSCFVELSSAPVGCSDLLCPFGGKFLSCSRIGFSLPSEIGSQLLLSFVVLALLLPLLCLVFSRKLRKIGRASCRERV